MRVEAVTLFENLFMKSSRGASYDEIGLEKDSPFAFFRVSAYVTKGDFN